MIPLFAWAMVPLLAAAAAQRSPYLGSSDPGVLPQYLPDADNRFGEESNKTYGTEHQMHNGTLETQDLYNRVSEWPDHHKPFWYLNANAIQAQREKEQAQQAQAAQQAQMNKQPPFSSSSNSTSGSRPTSSRVRGERIGRPSTTSSASRPSNERPFRSPSRD